ncbi:MAG: bifunctional phosphoribosylaminoimidazolecarboxamide formyltransferase/IMP cyclohydrolase [Planctomycetes bacterium]|nr:bifunctional phosphoribosylaminoimidazolecarboxamide formyltransferase/IMP cyclohydrolase [Planctomycetota bacterium]
MPIRRALLSVFDKTGIVDLATQLHAAGVELLSTGGTWKALKDAGLPVIEVADYTGFPEMMDGRVKTLHPKIHGGLLCVRDDAHHVAAATTNGIGMIDLVAVNLYPFEATADKPGATTDDKIEKIDIGGPSMLRSAAKNHRYVTVLVDPADYARCLAEMSANAGDTTSAFRARCARTVFRTTARYDALIADELTRIAAAGDPAVAQGETFPTETAIPIRKIQDLRYGENPHQRAALYDLRLPGAASVVRATQLHGKELSFNNLMDADAAWELVKEFPAATCAIIKHTNPCGCASGDDLTAAFLRAYEGDSQAAFGSIIALNRELDARTADAIADPGRFVEVIIAPSFSEEAFRIITTKPKWKANVRLISAGAVAAIPSGARYAKNVLGGLLLQDYDTVGWDLAALKTVSKRAPSAAELADLAFAWLVCKHLKSNAICLVKDRELVGAGAGQMSRVNSTWIATALAKDKAKGSVLASDAFFPFPDGVAAAAAAGVTAIVQPGGSKGDDGVIAEADKHGIAMVFTGVRHFRH